MECCVCHIALKCYMHGMNFELACPNNAADVIFDFCVCL